MNYPLPTILFLLVLSLAFAPLSAQTKYVLNSSQMSIEGTSNLHDWISEVTSMDATALLEYDGQNLTAIKSLDLTVRVEHIKSEKGGMMDNKTYKALDAGSYPLITYRLTGATLSGSDVNAEGTLTIAGNEQPFSMSVSWSASENGQIEFSGSQRIRMTDFGINPPKALLGALTTGDEVTVTFQVGFQPATGLSRK